IAAIILASYIFYRIITGREELSSLATASCVAVLQFMPGVLAVLYWPRASRVGFLAGLSAGFAVWFALLLLPLVSEFDPEPLLRQWIDLGGFEQLWSLTTIVSLGLNAAIFAILSALVPITDQERAAAEVCS